MEKQVSKPLSLKGRVIVVFYVILASIITIHLLVFGFYNLFLGILPSFSKDSLFWFFSSSAQTIAAFIALLAAGYAIVLTIVHKMEDDSDETSEEIFLELKKQQFVPFVFLLILSGLTIIFNILCILINDTQFKEINLLNIFNLSVNNSEYKIINVFAIDCLLYDTITIISGLVFIFSSIDPSKYEKIIKEKIRLEYPHKNLITQRSEFMDAFIKLEKTLHNIFDLPKFRVQYFRTGYGSVVEMVKRLYELELITKDILDEALYINRFRNLIFHGKIDIVDRDIYDRLIILYKLFNEILIKES